MSQLRGNERLLLAMNICLVGSMRDYARIEEIARELREHGHAVVLPLDESEARWSDRVQAKRQFMQSVFEKIKMCDAVLAVNDAVRGGMQGYIGSNTFLQLGLAMMLNKLLFCLAQWDKRLPYAEELNAMGIQILDIRTPF